MSKKHALRITRRLREEDMADDSGEMKQVANILTNVATQLADLTERMETQEKIVNGEPGDRESPGLERRVSDIERTIQVMTRLAWIVAGAVIVSLVGGMGATIIAIMKMVK